MQIRQQFSPLYPKGTLPNEIDVVNGVEYERILSTYICTYKSMYIVSAGQSVLRRLTELTASQTKQVSQLLDVKFRSNSAKPKKL
jgi:hypothetical protein